MKLPSTDAIIASAISTAIALVIYERFLRPLLDGMAPAGGVGLPAPADQPADPVDAEFEEEDF